MLAQYGVELLGAQRAAIEIAEDREKFKAVMRSAGLEVPASAVARSVDQAVAFAEQVGYPVLIRPSFTLGGTGGGIGLTRRSCASASSAACAPARSTRY